MTPNKNQGTAENERGFTCGSCGERNCIIGSGAGSGDRLFCDKCIPLSSYKEAKTPHTPQDEMAQMRSNLLILFAHAVELVPTCIVKGDRAYYRWQIFITDKIVDGVMRVFNSLQSENKQLKEDHEKMVGALDKMHDEKCCVCNEDCKQHRCYYAEVIASLHFPSS